MRDLLSQTNHLFENAKLDIIKFNVSSRVEMQTMKRTRPHYIVSYHKQGTSKLRIRDVIYEVEEGTVIFIPPNVEHDHYKDTDEETIFLWWHFTYEIANVLDVLKLFSIPLLIKIQAKEKFESVFLEYIDICNREDVWPAVVLKSAKSLEFLYLLLNEAMEGKQEEHFTPQMQNFISILMQIIKHPDQKISLKKLSEELYLHPTYISNRFKELFGKSPIQIHKELRINKAKALLKTSGMPVTAIANTLGFNNVSTFSRLFIQYVGISPTQFRTLNKKKGMGEM